MKIALIKGSYRVVGSELIKYFNKKKFMKNYLNFKIKYNIEKVIEELITNV